jgi:hypothetical protein
MKVTTGDHDDSPCRRSTAPVMERTGGKIRRKDCPTTPQDEQTTKLETKAMVAGHLEKTIMQQSPRANRRVTDGRKGDHE